MHRRPSHTPTKGSQRVPGVWPEMWQLKSTEQRAALRATWDQHQSQFTSTTATGGGHAPALSVASSGGDPGPAHPAIPITKALPAPYLPRAAPPANAHRSKSTHWPLFNAAVARPLSKNEVQDTPAAMQALLNEADKLQGRDTWDLTSVREWSEVAKEAKQSGKQAHVGRIFPIVVQRNSELPDGHPEKVHKGRIVYGWGPSQG